ncbi:hypothetical protein ACFVIM_14430 [Streptomyces sp. NPDC057638]|uniref:hypothetical protein n=1 Tax=Streptomyces sp. NPDC057638 TaxID=3346190 RepID=UPI003677234B
MIPPDARTTGEITVHHCTVTVVRRGGWSWGPEPKALVQRVVDALPELLEEHFARVLHGDGPDVEITGPVTLTVRPGGSGGYETRIDTLPDDTGAPSTDDPAQAPAPPFADSLADSFALTSAPAPPPTPTELLTELAARGERDAVLALLPPDTLRTLLDAVLGTDPVAAGALLAALARPPDPAASPASPASPTPPASPAYTLLTHALPPELSARLAAALTDEDPAALAALLTTYITRTDPPTVTALADTLTGPAATGTPARGPAVSVPRTTSTPRTATGRPEALVSAPRATGETEIWSALPFLLTGPLARIGYLDALGPTLAAAEIAEDAPLFAAALAYKVLGTTARGWRRAERDTAAAAAFAGLDPPVPEDGLVTLARLARPVVPVLDAVLALAVGRGHDPAEPLLLTGAGADDGLLLLDAQGVFPLAWTDTTPALLPHWRACGRPPVLIPDGPLPAHCLRELAAAGVPFLTAVRPLRGDPVTRLPGRTPLWTGTAAPCAPRLAATLPDHTTRLTELVRALITERRAVPLAPDPALERTVTLAATLALSTLAWNLWRHREPTDPLLALTRLADLDATVRTTPTEVRVRVPLGRRHADLLRAGLLTDVPDVPWLHGRTLTFTGG